jgi:hypothetical protein
MEEENIQENQENNIETETNNTETETNNTDNTDYIPKSEVEGLLRKRDNLLAELRKVKDERNLLSESLNKYKNKPITDNIYNSDQISQKRIDTELKTLREEKESLSKLLEDYKTKEINNIKERAISDSLTELNIKPQFNSILKEFFNNKLKVVNQDNKIEVLYESEDEVLNYKDFFKKWSTDKNNLEFISAPANKGASSKVSKDGSNSITGKLTLEEISKIPDDAARGAALKKHGYIKGR